MSVIVKELNTVKQNREANVIRIWEGQWRPLSYSVGHRLRPPSRRLWTDPDYPSRFNPQGPALLGCFPPKKTHFSGQRIPDTVPLNCENSLHNGNWEKKKTTNPPSFLTPPQHYHRHTWESKGAKPHPRNPVQYPGISCRPSQCLFSPSF